MTLKAKRTQGDDADFIPLVGKLTNFLAELNGEQDAFYAQFNKVDAIPNAIVAYADDEAVGCGAFRWIDEGTVEIKRMYVDPQRRGLGIGAFLLGDLERWAAELGATKAILETSKRLDAAVGLYRKSGYEVIDNYGPYVGVEDSVCLSKVLSS